MPAGKSEQNNSMLYGLITFVVLFIAATVFAIMFYIKYSDASTKLAGEQSSRRALATANEVSNIDKLIGEKDGTYLGTILNQFNALYTLTTGVQAVNDQSTQTKLTSAKKMLEELYASIGDKSVSPEEASFAWAVKGLQSQRDQYLKLSNILQAKIDQTQKDWDADVSNFSKTEEQLLAEKKIFSDQADEMQQHVNEIKKLAKEGTETQMSILEDQLNQKNQQIAEVAKKLAELENTYTKSEASRRELEKQVESIKPRPDIELEAYKPDAFVLSVDIQRGIAYLSIGSDDRVYRGLTFTIFDRSNPHPEDGVGKAEVKVFEVMSKVCAARIIESRPDAPVIVGDIAANLIWDSKTPYRFVVVGDFDLTGNGRIDPKGREKIIQLIRDWGGIISDEVSVNTDFVVAGTRPHRIAKPDENTTEVDPLAAEKSQQSYERYEHYNAVLTKAGELSIPVFDTRRFMNLIGYNTDARLSVPKR